jgi:hypothetical protein
MGASTRSEENFSRVEVTVIDGSITQVILGTPSAATASKLMSRDEIIVAGRFDQPLDAAIPFIKFSNLSRRHSNEFCKQYSRGITVRVTSTAKIG